MAGTQIEINKPINIVGELAGRYYDESVNIWDSTGELLYAFNVTAGHVTIENIFLNRLGIRSSGVKVTVKYCHLYKPKENGILVEGGWVEALYNSIWLDENSVDCCIRLLTADNIIFGNVLRGSPNGYCIRVEANENWVVLNKVFGGGVFNIYVSSNANIIALNYIEKDTDGRRGIWIESGEGNIVVGNIIGGVLNQGIVVKSKNNVIANNIVFNTGTSGTGARHGIHIIDGTQNVIKDNIIFDNQTTPTMMYAIYEEGTADNNLIEGNNVIDAPYKIHKIGANTIVKRNLGYVTENSVLSDTIAIDSTGVKTVTIPHGLDITPNKEDIAISVVEETDVDDWAYDLLKVDSVDATNVVVKIRVSTASGTAGATARIALKVGKP